MFLPADVVLKFERAGMQIIRWMCGVSMKYRKTSEKARVMGVGRQQQVKNDEDQIN